MLLLGAEAPLWFGRPPAVAFLRVLDALDSPWNVAHYAVMAPVYGVLGSLSTLLILYLLHAVFKRLWVAQTLVFLFGIIGAMGDVSWARGVAVMVFGAFGIVFISRVGPLCTSVFLATILLSSRVPLTLDLSAWYAGRSYAVLSFLALALFVSAYLSLGGKPLFGKAVFDD